MRNLAFAMVIVVLFIVPACAKAKLSAEQIYGNWRVTEVICSACGGPVLSLKSKVIEITKGHIVNPSGDDCRSSPELKLVKEARTKQVLAELGAGWQPLVHDVLATQKTILYGFVTCGGINYMQIALVSSDAAIYFLEDNTALALTRIKQ